MYIYIYISICMYVCMHMFATVNTALALPTPDSAVEAARTGANI